MIQKMHISGLGPHEATTIEFGDDGEGWTQISGPSQSGKSSIITALAFCWWGKGADGKAMPAELVREDAARAEVEVVFASGTSFRRTMTAKRSQSLWHNDMSAKSGEWGDALGALGEEELVRAIIAPLGWTHLAAGAGGGRPLRDLLLDSAGLDPLAVLEEVLEAGEPRDERGAAAARTAANRAKSEADGRLTEAAAALAELERVPEAPAVDLEGASWVTTSAKIWADYDKALESHQANHRAIAEAMAAHAAWTSSREALGERPKSDGKHVGALASARKEREAAEQQHAVAAEKAADARRAVASCHPPALPEVDDAALQATRKAYAAAVARKKDLPEGDACPTCMRPGWEGAEVARAEVVADLARLEAEGLKAKAAHEAAQKKAKTDHAAAMDAYRERLAALQSAAADMEAELAGAAKRMAAARVAADAAADLASDPAAAWDARRASIGPEPVVPHAEKGKTVEPKKPGMARPEAAVVEAARQALHAHDVAAEARRQAEGQLASARRRVERAEEAVAAATATAARAEEVVALVRSAPTRLAAQLAELLGDLGPVEILFAEDGKGGVNVLVDGLPWWCASRGRLAVADLHFRAAIRHASGLDWLPVIVDNAQDWSGEWPDLEGPIWLMRTEVADGLTVEVL